MAATTVTAADIRSVYPSTAIPEHNNFSEPNTSAVFRNNEDKDEDLAFYKYFINVYIDGLLCILGFMGNAFILAVLQRKKSKTSNTIFLQALAVFDSMFLLYVVLYVILRSIPLYHPGTLQGYVTINPYIVAFVLPYGWTAQTCTIWTVMVMAIDRYLVVSRPLRAIIWCTPNNAKKFVLVIFLMAVLFNVPRWLHYYYVAFVTPENNGPSIFVSHLAYSVALWDENLYRKIYHQSLGFILLFIIPLTIMISLNILLIRSIQASIKARKAMTNTRDTAKPSESSVNLTIVLVILITIFIVCELPDFIASVIGAISTNTKTDSIIYAYYAVIKEALLVLNSAINFLVYCSFYRRFRNGFYIMMGCRQPEKNGIMKGQEHSGLSVVSNPKEEAGSLSSLQTVSSSLSGTQNETTYI